MGKNIHTSARIEEVPTGEVERGRKIEKKMRGSVVSGRETTSCKFHNLTRAGAARKTCQINPVVAVVCVTVGQVSKERKGETAQIRRNARKKPGWKCFCILPFLSFFCLVYLFIYFSAIDDACISPYFDFAEKDDKRITRREARRVSLATLTIKRQNGEMRCK